MDKWSDFCLFFVGLFVFPCRVNVLRFDKERIKPKQLLAFFPLSCETKINTAFTITSLCQDVPFCSARRWWLSLSNLLVIMQKSILKLCPEVTH